MNVNGFNESLTNCSLIIALSKPCVFVWSTWPRNNFLQLGSQASKLKLLKTCGDSTRTFRYSIGTYGNLEGNCKLFLVCSTTMTLIFKTNLIKGVMPSYPKLWCLETWILVSILVNTSRFTPPLMDSCTFVSPIGNGPHPPKHKKWWFSTFETSSRTFATWCITCETCSISFKASTFGIFA